jgi:hypothetical protein
VRASDPDRGVLILAVAHGWAWTLRFLSGAPADGVVNVDWAPDRYVGR